MSSNDLINKARLYPGFIDWKNDYYQTKWEATQGRAQLLTALLTLSSGILGILSAIPNDTPSTLCTRLVYFSPLLLLSLCILVGGIALYDLLNMKSRMEKDLLKLLDEVLDQNGYQRDKVAVQDLKRTRVF